jgi:pimeloyl-ACP methyl ester carboxylesterase
MENPPSAPEETVSEEQTADVLFEAQFASPERIPFMGGQIEVVDLKPEHLKTEVPVLFVGGFGVTPSAHKEGIAEYYRAGRRVLSLAYDSNSETIEKEGVPAILATKAAAILEVLKTKGVPQVDVIAHSEGCMNATMAAAEAGDKFRHFVFVAPPGMTGKESYMEILGSALQNMKYNKEQYANATEEERQRWDSGGADIRKWVKGRGVVKGNIEAMAPGRFEIDDMVRALQEAGDGATHGVSMVVGVDDKMVHMEKFQKRDAASLGVDGFYSVKGGHSELSMHPDQYAYLAENALEALEQKYRPRNG